MHAIIVGSLGNCIHVFNTVFRTRSDRTVVAFGVREALPIHGARFPGSLAGPRYPSGIPLVNGATLEALQRHSRLERIDADRQQALLHAQRPVVAVTSMDDVPTGRVPHLVARVLRDEGQAVTVVRPPSHRLVDRRVRRMGRMSDVPAAHALAGDADVVADMVADGFTLFDGTDYRAVLASAELESDTIVWDGGSGWPYIAPDVWICVAGWPADIPVGQPNLCAADVIVTSGESGEAVWSALQCENPFARILHTPALYAPDAAFDQALREALGQQTDATRVAWAEAA